MLTDHFVEVFFDGIGRRYFCKDHWDAIVLMDALVASGRFKTATRWAKHPTFGWQRMQEWTKA